jgi:regulator of protease activity HflC (stomatin/prohibitin superfamily)
LDGNHSARSILRDNHTVPRVFDKVLDWVDRGWTWVKPFNVIDVFEKGAVLRFGKFHRSLEPGLHWKWPMVEQVIEITTCTTTMRLPPQTLTTKDGIGIVATAVVKYEIKDIRPYVTEVFDAKDVLGDVTMGAVRKAVSNQEYASLMADPPESNILSTVRKEVNDYGFKVHRVTFIDLAKVRSIRLISSSPIDLDN